MITKGKNTTVVGLGISGKAAAMLLNKKGANVYVTDSNDSQALRKVAALLRKKKIKVDLGFCSRSAIRCSDEVVISPGVRGDAEPLIIAKDYSIPVISEIELGWRFCKSDIIAVTGSNGKSTIATLIGMILKESGKDPIVCGNIGRAFSGIVSSARKCQPIVLETSSFQLDNIDKFKPRVSLISNITDNHMDAHADFDDYFRAKKNIYKNQAKGDFCILNYDDKNLASLKPKPNAMTYYYSVKKEVRGAFIEKGYFFTTVTGKRKKICPINKIFLPGEHNLSNILAACCCAYILGATDEGVIKTLSNFKGLPHRCEYVSTLDGVTYIDDSKSTSVGACASALKYCNSGIILIAGGRDKGSNFAAITELIRRHVKSMIAIGESKDKIINIFSQVTETQSANSMEEAVGIARNKSKWGDIVLLSPMCASFDMYESYSQRGEVFRNTVLKLAAKSKVRLIKA
jgi:UDP-N-acetylmuramoylalanine--D-glutamate ligase